MYYGIQVFDQTPRAVNLAFPEAVYEQLTNAPEGILSKMEESAREAYIEAGIPHIEPLHVTLHRGRVTEVLPGYTIEEAEAVERGEDIHNPQTDEGTVLIHGLWRYFQLPLEF